MVTPVCFHINHVALYCGNIKNQYKATCPVQLSGVMIKKTIITTEANGRQLADEFFKCIFLNETF